jgi:anti-sigma factor RsiW
MGYIDGELNPSQQERLQDHLALCVGCRAEETAYRRLGRVTENALPGRVAARLGAGDAWPSIYGRIERGAGWALLWIGITILSAYGLWALAAEFLLSSEVPLMARLGVGTLTAGALLLLISIIRDRLRTYGSERYREIER